MPSLQQYLSLVKFAHTVFALPFALVGLSLGFRDAATFDYWKLLLVLVCMVTARNAAMGFNRWADRDIDAENPRTAGRELPAGQMRPRQALLFVIVNCLGFIAATWFINPLCFFLSPVALLVILGYSYTKRFTALCHLFLGLGLGLAPIGAYLAVTAAFAPPIILLGAAVLTWVSGFDIIYALQDDAFDAARDLHSIPEKLGRRRALQVSSLLHAGTGVGILLFALWIGGGWLLAVAVAGFLGLLVYQHAILSAEDLSRVDVAFFTTNGVASLLFGALTILDIWLIHQQVYAPLLTLAEL
jgi:4-hydroxybenzoate polyprenyltransferase